MQMNQKRILVPVDFSRVSEVCMNHAYSIANKIGADIYLLHLVNKVEDLEDGRSRLASFADERQVVEGKDVSVHQSV